VTRGPSGRVLGVRVDRVDYDEAVARVVEAAHERRTLRVAAANVHVVMEARRDRELARLLDGFELVVPDGQPLRWALDATGEAPLPDRVYGPELARRVALAAAREGLPVFLYGATERVLRSLAERLRGEVAPGLSIAGALAPPFGEALWRAADADVERIRASGARVVLVGLGCPRQERWVGLFGERLGVPCLAVGAALELLAGVKPMAPAWMQRRGLEWLYRLGTEPGRTWRRYALHNPRFAVLAAGEVAAQRARALVDRRRRGRG
jgi:exopolysaccharide biosynthesis WecB/TagA/CpsF family protein